MFGMNSFTWGNNSSFEDTPGGISNVIGGREIFSYQKSNLSIPPGAKIFVPLTLNVQEFNRYYVHYFIDAAVEMDVTWSNNPCNSEENFVSEKTIVLAMTTGDIGRIVSGQTKAQTVKMDFTNVDSVLSLTSISIFVYGVK